MRANTRKSFTAQKLKFSIKDFVSKCDQIRSFPQFWLDLLNKSLIENFIFCAAFKIKTYLQNLQTRKFHDV